MPPATRPSPWLVEPLGKKHDRATFSCGDEILDRYLRETARQDARRLVAAPFVVVKTSAPTTMFGYYTLSSFAVGLGTLPDDVARKLPRYPDVPVTLLGRLAVDQRHRGQGIGEFLLMDALHRAWEQSSQIAAVAIVVDAIDNAAAQFYRHFDFTLFPDRTDRLFLPMKTIAALFAESK